MPGEGADVLVVGGGPAGSSCAWRLRRAGLDPLVLDQAAFPRDKPCAGWVTPAALEALEFDAHDYRQGRVFQPITAFVTGQVGAGAVETDYGRPVSFGILRREFDEYLLRRSRARVCEGVRVESVRRAPHGWMVNERFTAPMIVGAGGHFCPVARTLRSSADEPVVAAQEVEFRLDPRQQAECRVRAEAPELYFCGDLKGYGWCFRKADRLNVGFGRSDRRALTAQVRHFLSFLAERRRVPTDLPTRWKGHAYLLYETAPRPLVGERALLVGDAAGLAYSCSGEGILPAIESGLLAAETLLAARGRYDAPDLEPYRHAVEQRLGRRRPSRLPVWLTALVGRRLLAARWATRHLILDRWFLHARQPPLATAACGLPGLQGTIGSRIWDGCRGSW
jgi:flavin-dependent dehydrogenase